MEKINFKKMHGLGNDFVIIDRRNKLVNISKELINQLSDRKTGAGCDQLITINKVINNNDIDASIDIFNPNGDRAEACGNGTRCVAKILFDEASSSINSSDAQSKRALHTTPIASLAQGFRGGGTRDRNRPC